MMAEFHLAASAGSLSHCHSLLGHMNTTETLLVLLVTTERLKVRVCPADRKTINFLKTIACL